MRMTQWLKLTLEHSGRHTYAQCLLSTDKAAHKISQSKLKNCRKPPSKTPLHNGPFDGGWGEFISLSCEILCMTFKMVPLMVVGDSLSVYFVRCVHNLCQLKANIMCVQVSTSIIVESSYLILELKQQIMSLLQYQSLYHSHQP